MAVVYPSTYIWVCSIQVCMRQTYQVSASLHMYRQVHSHPWHPWHMHKEYVRILVHVQTHYIQKWFVHIIHMNSLTCTHIYDACDIASRRHESDLRNYVHGPDTVHGAYAAVIPIYSLSWTHKCMYVFVCICVCMWVSIETCQSMCVCVCVCVCLWRSFSRFLHSLVKE